MSVRRAEFVALCGRVTSLGACVAGLSSLHWLVIENLSVLRRDGLVADLADHDHCARFPGEVP
ncbi:hypothetical protein [Lentzea flaviverrucosa]|uniref:hypothetical protein n=1 Tax=Lentzea flaviverrucosa TaxID=200379 RepID=UPI0011C07C59|nr:hypothetical protein [Lentzea flaviverrucosa]